MTIDTSYRAIGLKLTDEAASGHASDPSSVHDVDDGFAEHLDDVLVLLEAELDLARLSTTMPCTLRAQREPGLQRTLVSGRKAIPRLLRLNEEDKCLSGQAERAELDNSLVIVREPVVTTVTQAGLALDRGNKLITTPDRYVGLAVAAHREAEIFFRINREVFIGQSRRPHDRVNEHVSGLGEDVGKRRLLDSAESSREGTHTACRIVHVVADAVLHLIRC